MYFDNREFWNQTPIRAGKNAKVRNPDLPEWDSIQEIIPGLFLTCESRVEDKAAIMSEGKILVINVCGNVSNFEYKKYFYDSQHKLHSEQHTQSEFFDLVDDYTSNPLPISSQRCLLLRTIPAEDDPGYDIGQHFMECSYLIELLLVNRGRLQRDFPDEKSLQLPSVVVHCLVGRSRSAAIVAAYLMKKYALTRTDAVQFIQKIRAVVDPNPGFITQLDLWQQCRYRRTADEWSACRSGVEMRDSPSCESEWKLYVERILTSGKLALDRLYVEQTAFSASGGNEKKMGTLWVLFQAVFKQLIEDEMFVDIPLLPQFLVEAITAAEDFFPISGLELWKDQIFLPFLEVFLNSISGDESNLDCVLKCLSLFLRNIAVIFDRGAAPQVRSVLGSSKKELPTGRDTPECVCFSFSFLCTLIPITVTSFLQHVSLDHVVGQKCEPSGDPLLAFYQIVQNAAEPFLKPQLSHETLLGVVKGDVELQVFRVFFGTKNLSASLVLSEFERIVESVFNNQSEWSHREAVTVALINKISGAVIGSRLLLEICDCFVMKNIVKGKVVEGQPNFFLAESFLSIDDALLLIQRVSRKGELLSSGNTISFNMKNKDCRESPVFISAQLRDTLNLLLEKGLARIDGICGACAANVPKA